MKIIEIPKFERIKCRCGCVYEHEYGDRISVDKHIEIEKNKTHVEIIYLTMPCPVCGRLNNLQRKNVDEVER